MAAKLFQFRPMGASVDERAAIREPGVGGCISESLGKFYRPVLVEVTKEKEAD